MGPQPYHRFVFDTEGRRFVGQFEEMYRAEDQEGFDSWFERDLRSLRKRLVLTLLEDYNFESILDVGCGKGTFTHLLKKRNNRVLGVDISPTAIAKARQSYPDVEFRCLDVGHLRDLDQRFDLALVMGVLAYVEPWQDTLRDLASIARWVVIAEYIPPAPIGFVKSAAELEEVAGELFHLRTRIVLDGEHAILLAESKTDG